jgi:hypothetical protein
MFITTYTASSGIPPYSTTIQGTLQFFLEEMLNWFNRLLKYLPPCTRRQPLKRSSLVPYHYH